MRWFRGPSARWMLLLAGVLSTGCAAAIGIGTVAVAGGAAALAFTCYDRVSVTVTDRLTGTKLCDAKVTFVEGSSETEATSCYQAALSRGKYTLRVERPGLAPFEEPVEVVEEGNCGQTVQTLFVALDRLDRTLAPRQISPPAATAPSASTPSAGVPAPTSGAPIPTTAPSPSAVPAPNNAPSPSATAPVVPAPNTATSPSAAAPSSPVVPTPTTAPSSSSP